MNSKKTIIDPDMENNMYYFAFGANMPKKEIKDRLGSLGSVENLGRGILDEYKIKFNKQSIYGSGKTNIIPEKNSEVIGVIYVLSKKQIEKLDKIEDGYDRITLNIKLDDGPAVDAEVYIAQQKMINDDLFPTVKYLNKLIQGAIEYEFPTYYIQDLQTTPTMKDSSSKYIK